MLKSSEIGRNGVLRFWIQNHNNKFIKHQELYKILETAVSKIVMTKIIHQKILHMVKPPARKRTDHFEARDLEIPNI